MYGLLFINQLKHFIMGYNTDFRGILEFTKPLTKKELEKLETFMDADCRNHPEWGATNLTWIDLMIYDDDTGLVWNGSEKSYDMEEKISLILREMKKEFPEFGLKGEMEARGEDWDDHWVIVVEDDKIIVKELLTTHKNNCPHCGKTIDPS